MTEPVQTVRNDAESRYEGLLEGTVVCVVDFVKDGDVLTITHTGTDPQHRGQGLAGSVTEAALADVAERGERVHPGCPFTVAYFDDHPEVADLRV